jgi:hypothetical protein
MCLVGIPVEGGSKFVSRRSESPRTQTLPRYTLREVDQRVTCWRWRRRPPENRRGCEKWIDSCGKAAADIQEPQGRTTCMLAAWKPSSPHNGLSVENRQGRHLLPWLENGLRNVRNSECEGRRRGQHLQSLFSYLTPKTGFSFCDFRMEKQVKIKLVNRRLTREQRPSSPLKK